MTRPAGLLCMMCALALSVFATPWAHAGGLPLPPGQQQQSQYDQYAQYDRTSRREGSPGFSKVGNIALTAAGTIVAGLFGSQFGTIGTVVGGAAGLFVSRWIADKIFPTGSTYGCNYGQSYWGGGRSGWGQSQWGQSPYAQVPFGNSSKWSTTGSGSSAATQQSPYLQTPYGGSRWSTTNTGGSGTVQADDLKTLQNNYIRTYNDFRSAAASGDSVARDRTKSLYDQAREAYYSAKNSSFH